MRELTARLGVALAALVLLAVAARADDKPEKVSPDKAPKEILDAIMGRFPKADISSIEKEKEDGKVMFDVELKHEGRKYEMDIKEDGTIVEIEKEVAMKDVPKAISDAIEAKYPKSTVSEVMEVNKVKGKEETPIHYEATLKTADGKEFEVVVSLDGKSVKQEDE